MAAVGFPSNVGAVPGALLGFIAGESPDGLVTLDGVPGRAVVDLLQRTGHVWVRRTLSAEDGSYRFNGLPVATVYNVIGEDPAAVYGDVIVSRVLPYYPPEITTTSLAFPLNMPASTQMAVLYGAGPFAWSVDVLPAGLGMSPAGLVSGMATVAGTTLVTVTVVDAHGVPHSRTYSVVVA